MKDKDKNKTRTAPDNDEKLEINKSFFQVSKELKKQREAELEAQQLEAERRYAEKEKQKREAYEKKLQDEKIELMRLKQGLVEEEQSEIHEEKEEEIKLSFWKKIGNFFYHSKWWLGLAVFFIALGSYLVYDLVTKPRPDMVILMLCDNDSVGNSVYLEEYFTGLGEDSNGNGKVLVSVYYIPYSDDDYQNYIKGVTNKLTNFLNNADSVILIGDKKVSEELLTGDDIFVDISSIYPDNPHIRDRYFFCLKDTDFAEKIGVHSSEIPDDMYIALRKPRNLLHSSKEDMQETYDKDFPSFERIIDDLSQK
ncbi:hypothetical protein [uncultured Ruminococcus sp.]|uniref:hypothetical protein n=1 Tax=uncultured Ruminococcus sp. TaxID=165186 RepID=UPI002605FF13|nr:hypothetical protein [uncultured Ruminococcus sp.]